MSIIDGIKEVANVVRKADNIDLYRQILDLQQEALELVEENYKIKSEMRELKDLKDMREKLSFKDNVYYLMDNDNDNGPFCSPCWDQDNKLIRLHENSYELFMCPICIKKN